MYNYHVKKKCRCKPIYLCRLRMEYIFQLKFNSLKLCLILVTVTNKMLRKILWESTVIYRFWATPEIWKGRIGTSLCPSLMLWESSHFDCHIGESWRMANNGKWRTPISSKRGHNENSLWQLLSIHSLMVCSNLGDFPKFCRENFQKNR